MPDLYDGWEDDVRILISRHNVCPNDTPECEAASRLRAAFAPHVHDWRWWSLSPDYTDVIGWLKCIVPGCKADELSDSLRLATADLPKYYGPDPLEKS